MQGQGARGKGTRDWDQGSPRVETGAGGEETWAGAEREEAGCR